jgi:hypothetical protein
MTSPSTHMEILHASSTDNMKGSQEYMWKFSQSVLKEVMSLRDLDVSGWIILKWISID